MKHKIENVENDDSGSRQKAKKQRNFHAKLFRQSLSSETALASVKEFVQFCSNTNALEDCAKEYLDAGGNCSELLRVITTGPNKNTVAVAAPVFQSFSIVLLKILSSCPEKQAAAEETCRELLNKHYGLVKSMLSLKSTKKQRMIALKLLSTMATVSSEIAKEVLVHTDFDQLLLKVLTHPTIQTDGKSVRTAFVHFLISFLIEGSKATKIALLKKVGFVSSIFPGMIYDTVDTINLLLTTLRSKVLEDTLISKTLKMNIFNTQTMQSLVGLYNWKGPSFVGSRKVKRTPVLDPVEKQLVGECVHEFLLVLCTSYKFGVIFHDPTVGLSGKNLNPLVYSVLQKIKNPWDQKLTSELVVKICTACPDLFKYVTVEIEPFLEPRLSSQWTVTIRFIKRLLESLTPNCVLQCFAQLSVTQIATIIEMFCAPKVLVKVISTNTLTHEHIGIRHQGILLLNIMFQSVANYLSAVKAIEAFSESDCVQIMDLVLNYLSKYLPPASAILSDWKLSLMQINIVPNPTISAPSLSVHLTKVLDVLYNYNIVCPQLVDNITKELDPNVFLKTVSELSKDDGDDEQEAELLKRAVNLLLLHDKALFLPTSSLFEYVLPKLLKLYYQTSNALQAEIEKCLREILMNTGIFEGCIDEIMIWLWAVLEQETYNDAVGSFFVTAVKKTHENFLSYLTKLSDLKEFLAEDCSYDAKKIIANLCANSNEMISKEESPRHTLLSPLILGIIDSAREIDFNNVSKYVNVALVHLLYLQTSPKLLNAILCQEKHGGLFGKHLIKYCKSFDGCEKLSRLSSKIYSPSSVVAQLVQFLTNENEHECFETNGNLELRYYHYLLLNKVILFYFSRLAESQRLTDAQENKCLVAIMYLLNKLDDVVTLQTFLKGILKHPTLLKLFNVFESKYESEKLCTHFIANIITEFSKTRSQNELDNYLRPYRKKLVTQLVSFVKKCQENTVVQDDKHFMEIIHILKVSQEQCVEVMESLVMIPTICLICKGTTTNFLFDLLCYILNQNVFDNREYTPFNSDLILCVSEHLTYLYNSEELNFESLENCLYSYLEKYPHSKKYFSEVLFKSLLHRGDVNKCTARLGASLLVNNKKYIEIFVEELEKVIEKRELIFTLLQAILKEDSRRFSEIFEKVYRAHENILIKYLNKPQKAPNYLLENYKVVQRLIQNCFTKERCLEFVRKTHKFDVSQYQHVEILMTVFRKSVAEEEEEKFQYISNCNTTIMNLLVSALKKAEKTEDDWNKITRIAEIFSEWLHDCRYTWNFIDSGLCKNGAFQSFSKFSLKFGLQGHPSLVRILNQLCVFVKETDSYLGDLFEMAVSHSEALNILLSESELKAHVLGLLLTLVRQCPKVMSKAHIPVWLGSYGATLSTSDQYLLQLMKFYEENTVGFEDYRPYMWGGAAVERYSVRYGAEAAIWRQPQPKDILNLFDDNIINNTIIHFPRYRSFKIEARIYSKGDPNVYDPAFYLPLLSYLLVPESTIKWFHCIKRGIIGLAFVALSSEVQEIRAAACLVLARFHFHLESTSQGKDRLLWLHLVETICRSTSKLDNYKISSVVAVFLGRAALVFTQPDHPLYVPLGNYFKAKETHDFRIVPQLLPLLHSTDANQKVHRSFILEVLRDGLRSELDMQVLFRTVAFKFLLDLFNSVLIDEEGRVLVLQILRAALRISFGTYVLTSNYSILPWLNMVAHQPGTLTSKTVPVYLDILSQLATCTKIKTLSYMKTNVVYFLTQFLDVLKTSRATADDLAKYLKALCDAYWVHEITTRQKLQDLINVCSRALDCRVCNYYLTFGCEFVETPTGDPDRIDNQGCYHLQLLTLKWLQANK